jgi:hypothetical protein
MSVEPVTFPDALKDPAASKLVSLNLFKYCAAFWRPNELYALNEYVRPNKATGFAYQATTAGTSGSREPNWPTVLSDTKADGSVTWTCVAASTNGLNVISSPSAVSEPTGLTISAVSVSESVKILATYSGGVLDQDYYAVFTFTLNGVSRVARQRVLIRKR